MSIKGSSIEDIFFSEFATLAAAPGGVQKLRELILQLAVQGRLVPQDPADEPASVLLERIAIEKNQLMKKGVIKKAKPLSPVAEGKVPYAVPVGWKWTRLAEISKLIHYGYTASANQDATDVRLLRITDIQNNRVNWMTVPGCDIDEKNYASYKLNNGDLLIARTGGTIGKSFLVENLDVSAVFASYLIRIIPSSEVYPEYLKVFADSPLYWEQLYSKCSGTGQPNVNGTALKSLIIPVPPLAEQHRIVAKVDALMELCDVLEAKQAQQQEVRTKLGTAALAALSEAESVAAFDVVWAQIRDEFDLIFDTPENVAILRQTVLQLAVQGKLVEQNPEDEPASMLLGRIAAEKARLVMEGKIKKAKPLPPVREDEAPYVVPAGWIWSRLGDITEKIGSGSTPKGGKSVYQDSGIKFFRSQNVWNDGISTENIARISKEIHEAMSGTTVFPKDILLNITGASIGRCSLVPDDFDVANVSQHVSIIRAIEKDVRKFLHLVIISPYFQKSIMEQQVGISREGLSKKQLELFYIPIPPLAEQHRIVAKVDTFMKLCDDLETRIKNRQDVQAKLLESVIAEMTAHGEDR